MPTLPLPCKLLVNKKPSLNFTSASSELKNVDEQVAKLGINATKRSYSLSWKDLRTKAEKNQVESFLQEVGLWSSFFITETSSEAPQVRVVCSKEYELSIVNNLFEITVDCIEVFQ